MNKLLLAVVLLAAPLAGCTSSGDGDSLDANTESRGWSISVTYPNGTQNQYNRTSDPSQADTDHDGLDDFKELEAGTDPRNVDTDDDRLLDGPTECPEDGSPLIEKAQDRQILEHPSRAGCYLGEERTEIGDFSYKANPTDAHTDSSPQLSDRLDDGAELVGWTVDRVGHEAYEVRSDPSLQSADTDRDGLHDGLEKRLKLDPFKQDTDDDGTLDPRDAAPLGNLKVTVTIESVNLKSNYKLGGGADLLVDSKVGQATENHGPEAIEQGSNQLGWELAIDVNDEGSSFAEALGGAYAEGNWKKDVRVSFLHAPSDGENEPIEVRSSSGQDPAHHLVLTYDAFEDAWTGHASDGSSSGADAGVNIELSSSVE